MILANHAPVLQPPTPRLSDGMPDAYERGLVERAKLGDSDAFARLFDFYADRVYNFMYFHVSNEHSAEDLTARVFLKAWRSIACYEPGQPALGAWLYLIARRAVIDFRQKQSRGQAVTEILSPMDEGLAAFELTEPCTETRR